MRLSIVLGKQSSIGADAFANLLNFFRQPANGFVGLRALFRQKITPHRIAFFHPVGPIVTGGIAVFAVAERWARKTGQLKRQG